MKKLYFAQEMNPVNHEEGDVYFEAYENVSIVDIITAMKTAESPLDRFGKLSKLGREIDGLDYACHVQSDDCMGFNYIIEKGTINIGLSGGNHLFDIDESTPVTEILERICRAERKGEESEYYFDTDSNVSDEDWIF